MAGGSEPLWGGRCYKGSLAVVLTPSRIYLVKNYHPSQSTGTNRQALNFSLVMFNPSAGLFSCLFSQKGRQQAELGANRGLGGCPQGHRGPADTARCLDGEGGKIDEMVASATEPLYRAELLVISPDRPRGGNWEK